jgi:MFS family permease
LDERGWGRALALCDRAQLTLPLADSQGQALPDWVRARIAGDFHRTAERAERIRAEFAGIAGRLASAGLDFVVLKGFAGAPGFVPDPRRRVQYDLDLYLAPGTAGQARGALNSLGYEPLAGMEEFPTDHLPVMIRKTGWQWRGDFFDPDIPVAVDLHFRLWDRETERFEAPGWEEFWTRRIWKSWQGVAFAALHEADATAYACLHLLRHLLRGSLRLSHVYELGWFLHTHAGNASFWQEWQSLHGAGLRRLEAVAFRLAEEWFGCRLADVARQEVDRLPEAVAAWFPRYARSPIEALLGPNKHELWLHLSLLDAWPARRNVLRRRLLPSRLPGPVDAVFVPERELTRRLRWRRRFRFLLHLGGRVLHHARVLPGVVWHGSQWLWRNSAAGRLGPAYWRFLGAVSVFNLGSFVFFVLYNLYLLDLGYREDMLGLTGGAMTAGSIVGTLPAARYSQRAGLRRALISCFGAMAIVSACRVLYTAPAALIAFAFLSGVVFSLFAVSVPPAIAQLSNAPLRPRAFSFFFAIGISLGIAGGLLAGRLPALAGSKQAALLAGCGLIAFAVAPALTLRFPSTPAAERRTYPRGPFMRRFLVVIAVWSLATGAFNPFFNAYFARGIGATVAQIGLVYSAAQLAQVAAVLGAPFVFRRTGLVGGVAGAQLACALALAVLAALPAVLPGVGIAAVAYAAYMGFHYMGEPGLYSMLMNRVAAEERSGASALNHLAMFSAQAVAAAAAGAAITKAGYSVVVAAAALLAVLAALLLWRLLPEQGSD